ncbi:PREDICTED: probable E3 ubiquitin-protein ligase LUL1 isoform X2 [Ipomoea nil]|nr:PREDICTED: probable E3 ubiquitin-protein ligase LUL1 isoform X2 [Ipomoea nil]
MVFVYTSVLAVFVMVIALLLKLMGFCDGGGAVAEGGIATESSGLLSKEAATTMYGVFDEEDEELGTCGRSSSYDDLFEGKVCAICYDKRRSWFFVPCGHCATCSSCTKRIIEGEAKTCPFCRCFIERVSRLLVKHQ